MTFLAALTAALVPWPWNALADCESGDGDGRPPYRASWYYRGLHEGGLQFAPSTWRAYRLRGYPSHAYLATPTMQIAVAWRVQRAQGWGAWPVCSRKVGLR